MCLCRFAKTIIVFQLSISLVVAKLLCEIIGFEFGAKLVHFLSCAFGLYDNQFENNDFVSPSIEGISDYDDLRECNWTEDKITTLSMQNDSLTVQLTNLKAELSQTKEKYSNFEEQEQQLHYLQSSNYEYEKTVQSITNEKSDLLLQITNLTKQIQETQSKLKISERSIIRLTQSKIEICSKAQELKTDKESLSEQISKLREELCVIQKYKHELWEKVQRNEEDEKKREDECHQILLKLNKCQQKYDAKVIESKRIEDKLKRAHIKLKEIQNQLHQKEVENGQCFKSKDLNTRELEQQIELMETERQKLLITIANDKKMMDGLRQLIEDLKTEHSVIREIECKNKQKKDAEIEIYKAREVELEQKISKISKEQKVKSDKLVARINTLKATQSMLQAKLTKDYVDLESSMQEKIDELQRKNEELHNASNQEKQVLVLEINVIKDQMEATKEELEEMKNIIHEKEQAIIALKTQNQQLVNEKGDILDELALTAAQMKLNFSLTSLQIKIANSKRKRNKSLSLCQQSQMVSMENGTEQEFGLLSFLANLKEQAVATMCSKFKRDSIDATHLFTMLTMTVIICNVKLHQLQTGRRDKPDIDKKQIKEHLEHLCVYIIRAFGKRKQKKEMIYVRNEEGIEISGQYYGYVFETNKKEYAENVHKWVQSYVENDGKIRM